MVALMAIVDTPKLAFPLRLDTNGARALVHEQGTDEEIMDCVEVLLSTEVGERVEVPDYGISPQEFREGGASREELIEAIRIWEDRAEVTIERNADQWDELIDRLRLSVKGRGND